MNLFKLLFLFLIINYNALKAQIPIQNYSYRLDVHDDEKSKIWDSLNEHLYKDSIYFVFEKGLNNCDLEITTDNTIICQKHLLFDSLDSSLGIWYAVQRNRIEGHITLLIDNHSIVIPYFKHLTFIDIGDGGLANKRSYYCFVADFWLLKE